MTYAESLGIVINVIQQNMREMSTGRTVIIIAHRLSALRFADRILTIERGRIVEDGSHDDLVDRNGRYAGLFREQSVARAA